MKLPDIFTKKRANVAFSLNAGFFGGSDLIPEIVAADMLNESSVEFVLGNDGGAGSWWLSFGPPDHPVRVLTKSGFMAAVTRYNVELCQAAEKKKAEEK